MTAAAGLETSRPAAAVVPIYLGEPRAALRAAEICLEQGVRVGCFRPPSVPQGRACLRITARASLTESELTLLGEALGKVAAETEPYSAQVTSGPTSSEHEEST
jgi:8-amino-7-oxononanoate synthase